MKWLLLVLILVTFVLWGVPAVRFIAARLMLLCRITRLILTKRAFAVFRSPLSIFAFNGGNKADMLVVCGDNAYLIKLGGSFKRATVITALSKTAWRFDTYTRVPSQSPLLMLAPTPRERDIRFDIVADAARLCQTTVLPSCTPVYLLCPKPLSIRVADNTTPLSNGDTFHGMHLHTATHLTNICDTNTRCALTKEQKRQIKTAFRTS